MIILVFIPQQNVGQGIHVQLFHYEFGAESLSRDDWEPVKLIFPHQIIK